MAKHDDEQAVALRAHVSSLLRLFLVNEKRFPVAGGQERYSPLDFQALAYLAEHADARMSDLADFLSVAPTTATTLVDRLVRRGFVDRKTHPTDKRAKALRLTTAGAKTFEAIYRQDIENMSAVLGTLEPDERATLVEILRKVTRGLDEVPLGTARANDAP